jgi:hypothetical protein
VSFEPRQVILERLPACQELEVRHDDDDDDDDDDERGCDARFGVCCGLQVVLVGFLGHWGLMRSWVADEAPLKMFEVRRGQVRGRHASDACFCTQNRVV